MSKETQIALDSQTSSEVLATEAPRASRVLALVAPLAMVGLLASGCSSPANQADAVGEGSTTTIEVVEEVLVSDDTLRGDLIAEARTKDNGEIFEALSDPEYDVETTLAPLSVDGWANLELVRDVGRAEDIKLSTAEIADEEVRALAEQLRDVDAKMQEYFENGTLANGDYESLSAQEGNIKEHLSQIELDAKRGVEEDLRSSAQLRLQPSYKDTLTYSPVELKPTELFAPNFTLSEKDASDSDEDSSFDYGKIDFAEVVVGEEGDLDLNIAKDLDEKSRAQLQAIYKNVEPFLRAAFQNGTLERVRLVVGEAGSTPAYYSRYEREIVVGIPQYGDSLVTLDQIEGTLTHEVMHALTSRTYTGVMMDKDDFMAFSNGCMTLAENVMNQLDGQLLGSADAIRELQKYATGADVEQVFIDFMGYVERGELEKLIELQADSYSPGRTGPISCFQPGTLTELIQNFAHDSGRSDFVWSEDVYEDDNSGELDDLLRDSQRKLSLYAILNESAYAKTTDPDLELLGHSEDNVAEQMASFLHANIRNLEEITESINLIGDIKEKEALVSIFRTTIDAVRQDNPELSGWLLELESDFLERVNR